VRASALVPVLHNSRVAYLTTRAPCPADVDEEEYSLRWLRTPWARPEVHIQVSGTDARTCNRFVRPWEFLTNVGVAQFTVCIPEFRVLSEVRCKPFCSAALSPGSASTDLLILIRLRLVGGHLRA
jgi:hypothetical protein